MLTASVANPPKTAAPLRPASVINTLNWMRRLYGLRGTATLIASKLAGRTGTDDDYSQWRDRLSDRHLNIETASPVAPADLGGSDDIRGHAVEYRPTSGVDAAGMIDRLPIDKSAFHFLDLGCGKGRVVLIARSHAFASVTGVEFSPDLVAAARRNLVTAKLKDRAAGIRLLEGDARDTAWPDGPLVVYLYNPFGRPIMRDVEASLAASLSLQPRDCYVIYANPQHADVFGPRWESLPAGDDWWTVYRWNG